jgi:hypothetical protein
VNALQVQQLETPFAEIQSHLSPVLDLRRHESITFQRIAHLRRDSSEFFDTTWGFFFAIDHGFGSAFVRDYDRGRRKNKVAGRMVGMRFRVD